MWCELCGGRRREGAATEARGRATSYWLEVVERLSARLPPALLVHNPNRRTLIATSI